MIIKPDQSKINITGAGIISPVGDTTGSCFHALINNQSGINAIQHLETLHHDSFPVGEVKHSNNELINLNSIGRKQKHLYTRASLLSAIAIREAILSASLPKIQLKQCALISATTVGGMDKTEQCYRNPGYTSVDYIYTHPCGDATDKMCEMFGLKGYRSTLSTACSSAANAIIHGAMLIKNGLARCVIAGGVDPLCKFTLNGFNSLMILDHEPCRPFDENRNGLNLGEGAGYLVMESDQSVSNRNARVLCHLSGYANTNDAYHPTASSPDGEGARLAMDQAIASAGLQPGEIDYINVHGTGTQNNDLSESIAIKRVFGSQVPPFSSTKSMTGHALGAAAAIEAVFSVLALINNTILPQINFSNPIPETDLIPEQHASPLNLNHVMTNSFGFGGNNSTLIFSK